MNKPNIYSWINDFDKVVLDIKNGKIGIVGTDTVFGVIGLSQTNIYKVKNRPFEKKLGVFVSSINDIRGLKENEREIVKKYWPGGLSTIKNNLNYRVPNDKNLIKLCKEIKIPIYQSSANVSGNDPIKTWEEALETFKDNWDKIFIIVSEAGNTKASTIVNLDNYTVVREGPYDGKKIIEEIKRYKIFNLESK